MIILVIRRYSPLSIFGLSEQSEWMSMKTRYSNGARDAWHQSCFGFGFMKDCHCHPQPSPLHVLCSSILSSLSGYSPELSRPSSRIPFCDVVALLRKPAWRLLCKQCIEGFVNCAASARHSVLVRP